MRILTFLQLEIIIPPLYFLWVFNPSEPSNSAGCLLSISFFRIKKKYKIDGVVKILRGNKVKTPYIPNYFPFSKFIC